MCTDMSCPCHRDIYEKLLTQIILPTIITCDMTVFIRRPNLVTHTITHNRNHVNVMPYTQTCWINIFDN